MRRKHSGEVFDKSFESYLGVVTKNGLGMLILVAMASTFTTEQTLSQGKFKRSLGAPMLKSAPEGRQMIFFECSGNRIQPIDFDSVQPHINRIFGFNKMLSMAVVQELNAQKTGNEHHYFEFHDNGNNIVRVQFKAKEKAGFSLEEFKGKEEQSEFSNYLGRWDAQQKILSIVVRPDSFEVFRQAREVAKAKGFLLSWEPMLPEKDFVRYWGFGLGGDVKAKVDQ